MPELVFAGCRRQSDSSVLLLAPGHQARELSLKLGSFSPRLDRDLAELAPRDGGLPEEALDWKVGTRLAVLSESGVIGPELLRRIAPTAQVLLFEGTLDQAADGWGRQLAPGRVVSIAARRYSREQRDVMRSRQRLLPLHEVDMEVAALTAVDEAGDAPLWLRLSLDLLDATVAPGAVSLETLRTALSFIPGERVVGFEVVGFPAPEERNPALALTGVELLRDNILSWFTSAKERYGIGALV